MISQSYYGRDPRVRRAAEALLNYGFEVDLYCLREAADVRGHGDHSGLRFVTVRLARRRGGKLRYLFEYVAFFLVVSCKVAWHSLGRRYALIFVHTLPDVLVFTSLFPRLFGTRVLLDMHDPMPETLVSKYQIADRHPLVRVSRYVERQAIRYADAVITVHEPLRELFADRSGEPGKIQVVMNLADVSGFRRRHPVGVTGGERFTILYAGTVSRRYGVDLAIAAVAKLRDEIPRVLLRVVGEGDYLDELSLFVRSSELKDYVEFLPAVPYEAIPELMDEADVGISPHRPDVLGRFSLSNKIYEYIAVGIPAVVPQTACLQRYYPDDVVRYFIPGDADDLARAILELYRSSDLRRSCVEAGWRLIDRWNWPGERTRLVNLVNALTDGGHEAALD